MLNSILYLIFISILLTTSYGYDREMTVHVDAGKLECFFHPVKFGETFDIEYQVIDGGHGDLDISFSLYDPIGMVIVNEYKKQDNIHRHEVQRNGDYRFCFDNTFSTFNRKTIFFELIVENDGQPNAAEKWNETLQGLTAEEYYDMKIQDIMDYIGRIRIHITRARQIQDMIRSHEARDRNLAEANFFKVNAWSFFQIFTMVCVGLIQVFMVKSIFEIDSRMSQIWKKFKL